VSKIRTWLPWDPEARITVLARTSSSLALSQILLLTTVTSSLSHSADQREPSNKMVTFLPFSFQARQQISENKVAISAVLSAT
jgi:hypothetical protein